MNSKNNIFLTKRLNLRPFTGEDFALLHSLHTNSEVARTTIDGIQSSEVVKQHLASFISHQAKYGYSQWAVFENSSKNFIGRAGLTKRILNQEIGEQVEVRFAFLPQFWGLGYASEVTEALVQFGFKDLKLQTIIASHGLSNEKSAKILLKNGFKYLRNITPEGYGTSDQIKYYVLQNLKEKNEF